MFDPLSAYVDVFLLVLSSGGGEGGVSAPGTGPDFVPLRDEEAPVCAAHVRGLPYNEQMREFERMPPTVRKVQPHM